MIFTIIAVTMLIYGNQAYDIPCTKYGHPSGCNNNRIKQVTCGSTPSWVPSNAIIVGRNSNTDCMNNNPRLKDTITNTGSSSNTYYVEFDAGSNGQCYGIVMQGGECWGSNPNGGNYNCQGRCGPGCGSWACSNWGRDCLKHDVCSWYFHSSGGGGDANCGDEWDQAQNDWAHCCVWPCQRKCKGQSNTC